ncbi:MAG TPA: hypothetical protein VHA52_13045 [Candidatus Babeliaceae bacterium]|nr:hypothetical protein [Candidatus Babeliaceae bacterium]
MNINNLLLFALITTINLMSSGQDLSAAMKDDLIENVLIALKSAYDLIPDWNHVEPTLDVSLEDSTITDWGPEGILKSLQSIYNIIPSWDQLEPWQKSQAVYILIAIASIISVKYFGGSIAILSKLLSFLGLGGTSIKYSFNNFEPITQLYSLAPPLTPAGAQYQSMLVADKMSIMGHLISSSAIERAITYLLGLLTLIPTLQFVLNGLKNYIWPNQENTMAQPNLEELSQPK